MLHPRTLFAVACLAALVAAAPRTTALDYTEQYNGGNCGECAWILAEGTIQEGDAEKLRRTMARLESPRNIRFNSPGGDVIEALKLGRFLRASKWDTFVGEESPMVPGTMNYRTQGSVCHSACVYAFLGGVHRTAAPKSLGVHQFYRPVDANNPTAKTMTATDAAQMQMLSGALNEYVREMGADTRLVTIASAITPWEPIYLLGEAELRQLGVDTTAPASGQIVSSWHVAPLKKGASAVTVQRQDGANRTASLSVMCSGTASSKILLSVDVQDSSKAWDAVFPPASVIDSVDIEIAIDGKDLPNNESRLVRPISRTPNGASILLALTQDELATVVKGRTLRVSAFQSMVLLRGVGDLGGNFSMRDSAAYVELALRTCVD